MASSTETMRLKVLNNNVELGVGKSLPPGVYPGYIEWMHFNVRGVDHKQESRVMIKLTEAQIASALGVPADPNRLAVDFDVLSNFLKGDVVRA